MKTSSSRIAIAVRSYELDSYRHVNNAAYLNWLEEARERFLREQGRDYHTYPESVGAYIVVVRIEIDYLRAAVGGDEVAVTTRLARMGRSSVVYRHVIRRSDGQLLARARVVMAFAGEDDRSVEIPGDYREHFEVSPEGDVWTDDEGGERR